MVFTVSFALSPVIGLSCHRRRNASALSSDASVEASGPRDFAVRVSVTRQLTETASIASRPTFVTMANAPREKRDDSLLLLLLPQRQARFLKIRIGILGQIRALTS